MSTPNFKPWRFVGQGILIDEDENEIVLGNVYSDDPIGWLISSAPEMYAALFGMVKRHERYDGCAGCLDCGEARSALAKAEGR